MEPANHSPIHNLPPELLASTLTYLTRQETYPLLLVSKHFHSISLPRVWHTLSTSYEERTLRSGQPMQCVGLRKLVANAKETGFETIEGFKYVKEIKFNGPEDLEDTAAWITTGLLEFVTRLIETGDINLVRLEMKRINARGLTRRGNSVFDLEICYFEGFPVLDNFLKAVKLHSKATVSLELTNPGYKDLGLPFELFNPNRITCLDIHHTPTWSENLDHVESVIRNTTNLISILEQTPYLKTLMLFLEYPLDNNPKVETRFQTTISNLSHLEKLQIYTTLFNPSFFLTPPSNIKALVITANDSMIWWKKLSKYAPTKLEDLIIFAPQTEDRKISLDFDIESLELKTLKKFYTGMEPGPAPRDFFDLLYSKNPRLGKDPNKAIREMRLKMKEGIEQYQKNDNWWGTVEESDDETRVG